MRNTKRNIYNKLLENLQGCAQSNNIANLVGKNHKKQNKICWLHIFAGVFIQISVKFQLGREQFN